RNGDIKIRHHPSADRQRKGIGNDRWRSRAVSAFTYTDEETHRKQERKRRRQSASGCRGAPENHAYADDHPARKSVGHPAKNQRANHVTPKKRAPKRAAEEMRMRVVRREKVRADFGFHRREHVTVDEIEEVNGKEQCERGSAAGDWTVFGLHH